MKLYLLVNPRQYEQFARISHVGTWTDSELCSECGQHDSRLTSPLQIEFEPDSDCIGDFSWCGYTMVVLAKVRGFLREHAFGCRFGRVEVVAPTTKRRGRKQVPFPYVGPKLYWLRTNARVPMDLDASGVEVETDCPLCKRKSYKFQRSGLVIRESDWNGEKLFHLSQYSNSSATYVVESALEEMISAGFTNMGYREVGVVR